MADKTKRNEVRAENQALRIMAEILQSPKKIDELKRLPAYVKDGVLYDFCDRKYWTVNVPDGEIFSVEKVNSCQAVTVSIKTNYIKALTAWMGDEPVDTRTDARLKPPLTDEDKSEPEPETKAEVGIDLLGSVKELLDAGKLKKAKKLIKENAEHSDAKKAKKLYKKVSN